MFPLFNQLIEDSDTKREDIIYLKSNISEIFASTDLTQNFINHLDNPIKLIISFPIKEEKSLTKFFIKIGEKKETSKIIQKEKTEEKYDNSIYQGNTGFLNRYNDNEMKIILLT